MNNFPNLKPPEKKKMSTADCLKKIPLSISIKKIAKPKEKNIEKYLSMLPKSVQIRRIRKPAPAPIFKIPSAPPLIKIVKPVDIEIVQMDQTTILETDNASLVPFTDINSLDRRSKILENTIDLMTRNTAKLLIIAEIKERKLMKLMKIMNVKIEKEEDIQNNIDVDLPISTVEDLNELNKRLMDDRIFYQKFFKYLNTYRTKGTCLLKIISKIATAECIACYNWDGSFNKLGLKNLLLFSKFLKEYCIAHDMANELTYIPEIRKAIHKFKNIFYKNQPIMV